MRRRPSGCEEEQRGFSVVTDDRLDVKSMSSNSLFGIPKICRLPSFDLTLASSRIST